MQSLVFLTYFFQKSSKKNLWGLARPILVQEGLKFPFACYNHVGSAPTHCNVGQSPLQQNNMGTKKPDPLLNLYFDSS